MKLVSDIMVRKVFSISENGSVKAAAVMLAEHDLDGLPVTADDGTLVGVVTQSDLVTKIAHVHIPTLLDVFKRFDLYRKDKKFVKKQLKKLDELKVRDVMNTEPPHIVDSSTIDTAIMHLSRTHINPTAVVSLNRKLVGVVTRFDILKQPEVKDIGIAPKVASMHPIDVVIEQFLKDFSKQFLFISRARTRAWLFINISFIIFGITIALIFLW